MFRRSSLALAVTSAFFMTGNAIAAEPIVGNWKTQSGANATIAACGSSYCIKLTSGEFSGKQIGKVKGSGKNYKGKITDPAKNKTYSGKAAVTGNKMKMSGCVLGGLICQGQTWTRR